MRLAAAIVLILGGCSAAPDFTDLPMDRRSGVTAYRIDDLPNGAFVVSVRQDVGRFWPTPGQTQDDCRREAVAIAIQEGHRRGVRVDVDDRTVRTAFGRNPVTSISSCTGQAQAVVSQPGR